MRLLRQPAFVARNSVVIVLAVVGLGMVVNLIPVRDVAQAASLCSFLGRRTGSTYGKRERVAEKEENSMASNPDSGIVAVRSNHSVDQTVEKIEALLQARGVKLFALVDHSGEAAKVGMNMRPTRLLIFGNPKSGTPLMLASPSVAIDLPLKILVAEDSQGQVWISYNSPSYLQARHNLPQELVQNIAVVATLAASAAE